MTASPLTGNDVTENDVPELIKRGRVNGGYGSLLVADKRLQLSVREWAENHLAIDNSAFEKLQTLYDSYLETFAGKGKPASKPVFSRILQLLYEAEMLAGQIELLKRSGQCLLGVRLEGKAPQTGF